MQLYFRWLLFGIFLVSLGCAREKPTHEAVDLYPVKVGRQYGYINAQGTVVIEPQFFSVNWFKGDRAIVETAPGKKAMIDQSGKIVFQDTSGFLHLEYQDGLVKFEKSDRTSCFIDKKGAIRFCLGDSVLYAESAFSCNRLLVRLQGSTFAYLDTTGKEVYRFKRGFPSIYKEEMVRRSFNGRACYFDLNGKRLFCIQGAGSDFASGRAMVAIKKQIHFIDKHGEKKISQLPFDQVSDFVEGFAVVQKDKRSGFIDVTGKVVIPPVYQQVFPFSSEVAAVLPENGRWKFINSKNEQVIAPEWDEVATPGFRGALAYVRQGATWGYINKKGVFIWKSAP